MKFASAHAIVTDLFTRFLPSLGSVYSQPDLQRSIIFAQFTGVTVTCSGVEWSRVGNDNCIFNWSVFTNSISRASKLLLRRQGRSSTNDQKRITNLTLVDVVSVLSHLPSSFRAACQMLLGFDTQQKRRLHHVDKVRAFPQPCYVAGIYAQRESSTTKLFTSRSLNPFESPLHWNVYVRYLHPQSRALESIFVFVKLSLRMIN